MTFNMIENDLRLATACVEAGGEFLEAIETLSQKMTRCVDNAIAKVDEIQHSKVKQASRVRPCFQQFRIAVENASSFVERFHDFTFYCSREDRMTKVLTAVRGYDFEPLEELIDQLQRCLAQAVQFYWEFEEAYNNSSKNSSDKAAECKHQAIKARNKKRATRAIGGAAAAGALGGGIALSVVVGVFTFGIGTAVGLGVTAGALGAGGVATSVVTGVIAKDFNDAEKAFRELSRIFDSLAGGAYNLYDNVLRLHTILEGIATVLEDIDVRRRGCRVESVCDALELLYEKNAVAYFTTASCRDSMKAIEQKVRDKM